MAKAFIPKIPKGNLGLVYVLSKIAADDFFRAASRSIKKHWPIPKEYQIPDTNGEAKLITKPDLWLPWGSAPFYDKPYKVRGIGNYGIQILYETSNRENGLGKVILDFLCEVERCQESKTYKESECIAPNSNVFIYHMLEHEEINLPDEAFRYDCVRHSTEARLNEDIKPAFKRIEEDIRTALKKRSAILTRGWFGDSFVS